MPTMNTLLQENAQPPEDIVQQDIVAGQFSPIAENINADPSFSIESTIKSSGSIRKSALPPKAQKAFNRCTTNSDASEIAMEDVLEGFETKERAVKQNRQLKVLVVSLVIAVIFLCAGSFATSFAAVQLSKESRISDAGVMVDLNSANGDKVIVQVAPSTESKLDLFHALVLSEAHLRTLDEIVYTYYPSDNPGRKRTASTKVLSVERDSDEEPWEVNVTIKLEANLQVIIRPQEETPLMLLTGGERYPLCGCMKCSNFMIDDPDLDATVLDERLAVIFNETGDEAGVRRLKQRRLWNCPSCTEFGFHSDRRRRRQRRRR